MRMQSTAPTRSCRSIAAIDCGLRASFILALFGAILSSNMSITANEIDNRRAILIGVDEYASDQLAPVAYATNDVNVLANTLCGRAGFVSADIEQLHNDRQNPKYKPTKEAVQNILTKRLPELRSNEALVVYFRGHAIRDENDRLFLATADTDMDRLGDTAIPVLWLREQLENCAAEAKLLLIDTKHTDSAQQINDTSPKDIARSFADIRGMAAITAGDIDQLSQIDDDLEQSLFAYGLVQTFKGHADANGNGTVDLNELYKFVRREVSSAAKELSSEKQYPVRLGKVDVSLPIAKLRPLSLKELLDDIAEQLARSVAQHGYSKVGALEFTADTSDGEQLGTGLGVLGRYCADELQSRLMSHSHGKFSIIDRVRLNTALANANFTIDELRSPDKLARLADKCNGLPAIVLGTVRGRAGQIITIQCRLMATKEDLLVGMASGTAHLTTSEWAMLGKSAAAPEEEKIPDDAEPTEDYVEKLDEVADGPHPMKDPGFPLRISLLVDGQLRKGVFRENQLLVPVSNGEEFKIRIENKTGEIVCMRLLVDGLNTLPQAEDKEPTRAVGTYEIAKAIVNLDDARHYIMRPSKTYQVPGFIKETGANGQAFAFKVTDASRALAVRKSYTQNVGLITAAFYKAVHTKRGPGVTTGSLVHVDVPTLSGIGTGDPIAIVHLRLAYPEEVGR